MIQRIILSSLEYMRKYHFICLAVCYSQMHGRTVILKLWLHNNNKWLNNKMKYMYLISLVRLTWL